VRFRIGCTVALAVAGILSSVGSTLSLAAQMPTTAGATNVSTATANATTSATNVTGVTSAARPPVSREQLVLDALARIDRLNPTFNAFTGRNPSVTSRAQLLDSSAGTASAGILDRRTIAVKANIELADVRASAGVRASGRIETGSVGSNAFAATQIENAGGLIVGVTNMDSWARGTKTVSEFGSTGNAFNPQRSPLGSSGGSAVAVATGMVDMAVGTDTCGSIRYPASANGIFGLRPTVGSVSRAGVVPLSPTQDVVGPLARNVGDLEVLFRVLTTPDPQDPFTQTRRVPMERVGTKRVGVLSGFGAVSRSMGAPLAQLQVAGYELVELSGAGLSGASVINDEFEPARSLWRRNQNPYSVTLPVSDLRGYRRRLNSQVRLRNRLVALMDTNRVDALVYPTTVAAPGARGARQITGNCWLAANSGLPALAVPGALVGRFPAVGVDLLGRPFDESTLFAMAGSASPVLHTPTVP
jgi:amidase